MSDGTVDITTLGLAVDSTGVTAADGALNEFSKTAEAAAVAANKVAQGGDNMVAAMLMASKTNKDATNEGEKFLDQLMRQVAALGRSRDELLRNDIEMAKLTETQREAATLMADYWKKYEDSQQSAGESAKILKDVLHELGIGSVASAAAITGVGAAFLLVVHHMTEAIAKFAEAEAVELRLDAVISATGGTAERTTAQIVAMSNEMQKSTTFTSESIQKAATSLMKFGDIHGETFDRAVKLSGDLAAVMGTDITSAAEMVGRALENSYGASMLRRQGLLTDGQVEYYKALKAVGQEAEAQAFLFETLEGKAGGVAKALGEHGVAAAQAQLSHELEESSKSLGKFLSDTIHLEGIIRGITGLLHDWHEVKMPDWAGKLLLLMANPAVAMAGALGNVIDGPKQVNFRAFEEGQKSDSDKEAQRKASSAALSEQAVHLEAIGKSGKEAMANAEKQLDLQQRIAAEEDRIGQFLALNTTESQKLRNDYAGMSDSQIAAAGAAAKFASEIKSAASEAARMDLSKFKDMVKAIEESANTDIKGMQQAEMVRQQGYAERIRGIQDMQAQNQITKIQELKAIEEVKVAAIASQKAELDAEMERRAQDYNQLEASRQGASPEKTKVIDNAELKIRTEVANLITKMIALEGQRKAAIDNATTAIDAQATKETQALKVEQDWFNKRVLSATEYVTKLQQHVMLIGKSAEEQAQINAEQEETNKLLTLQQEIEKKIAEEKPTGDGTEDPYLTQLRQQLATILQMGPAWVDAAGAAARYGVGLEKQNKEMQQVWNDLNGMFTNFFDNLLTKGKSAWASLWTDFKNWAFKIFAEVMAKQVVVSIIGAISGGGAANSWAGGAGGIGNLLTGGSSGGGGGGGLGNLMNMVGMGDKLTGGSGSNGIMSALGLGGSVSAGTFDAAAVGGLAGGAEAGVGAIGGGLGLAGLSSIMPYVGIGLLAYSMLSKKGGGPMTRDYATSSNASLSDFQAASDTHKLVGTDAQASSDYGNIADQQVKSYADTVKLLGGTVQDFKSFIYSSMDPKGKAGSGVQSSVTLGGKEVYNQDTGLTLGRDPKEVADRVALEASRGVFAALQQSSLPKDIGDMFNKFTASSMSASQINSLISVGTAWASLLKSLGDQIPPVITNLFKSLDPTKMSEQAAKDLAAFGLAYASVADVMSRDPIADAMKSMEAGTVKLTSSFADQGAALKKLSDSYDGSEAASVNLTKATQGYYGSLVALIAQIEQVKKSVGDMFSSSVKGYTVAGMAGDKESLRSYYSEDARTAAEALTKSKDADEIKSLSARIDADQKSIFGLLSPEEQKQQWQQFVTAAESANTMAQTQLSALETQTKDDFAAFMAGIKTVMDAAAAKIAAAGDKMANAADSMSVTATTPTPVVLHDPSGVEIGGG